MRGLIETILRPRWIVDEDGDPGIALGRGPLRYIVGYYKHPDLFIVQRASTIRHRQAGKRELNIGNRKVGN